MATTPRLARRSPPGGIDEQFALELRSTCNPPMHADADVRLDPRLPGCFARPLR